MHPPVHTLNRVCTKTYKVPGENFTIEKGSKILVTLTGIQQDPEYYERPKEYYPDHFTDENRRKRHPLAHMPFGVGPRECIGEFIFSYLICIKWNGILLHSSYLKHS